MVTAPIMPAVFSPLTIATTAGTTTATGMLKLPGTICSIDDGNSAPSGGKLPDKFTQTPHSFAIRYLKNPIRPTNPETGRPFTTKQFKKTFGVSVPTLFRSAQGVATETEQQEVQQLIATEEAAASYLGQLVFMRKVNADYGVVSDFMRSLTNQELIDFIFQPETRHVEFSIDAFQHIVRHRLLQRKALLKRGDDTAIKFDMDLSLNKVIDKYFKKIALRSERHIPAVTGQNMISFLIALQDRVSSLTPQYTDRDISNYISGSMHSNRVPVFEATMLTDPLLHLRVALSQEKRALRINNNPVSRWERTALAALEAGALDPGRALETSEKMRAYPHLGAAYAEIIVENIFLGL